MRTRNFSYRCFALFAAGALFAGCGGTPPEPPQPEPAVQPAEEPAEEPAAAVEEAWAVEPASIRFDGDSKTLFVEAALKRTDGGPQREEPVHVGVTVVTTDGEEIDLMVQTLFPGNFDMPVLFTAGLEHQVQDVLIGAWSTRVEPCEVDRYGCREFGFVLDGSLASWPRGLYSDGMRQRIPIGDVVLRVRGEPTAALEASDASLARLEGQLAVFGVTPAADVDSVGEVAPTSARVIFGHKSDQLMAIQVGEAVTERLAVTVDVQQGDTEGATFLVVLE